jgi:hypothetical protein
MYSDAIKALADQAAAKLAAQRRSLVSHFVRSMLAGMYVGAAIVPRWETSSAERASSR